MTNTMKTILHNTDSPEEEMKFEVLPNIAASPPSLRIRFQTKSQYVTVNLDDERAIELIGEMAIASNLLRRQKTVKSETNITTIAKHLNKTLGDLARGHH